MSILTYKQRARMIYDEKTEEELIIEIATLYAKIEELKAIIRELKEKTR